ncbi:ABC transporter permease [Cytophaga sp. FL35]|uniref:ABC transporter permease n=1 Tax=Cytophaga sp. FL35 TaxID=1904456 RepID=UPI001653E8E6|nr:ABC transporter permease [Cytophaga sp. FL35]MBC6998250.1 ABC transporter permease [Cytophaga sp. FL35]
MRKLLLIIKREYLAKVRNKSFVIMTFLSPILMVGMVVLIAYLTKVNDNDHKVIAILNESNFFSNEFVATTSTSYVNFDDVSLETAKDSVASLGFYGLLYIPDEIHIEKVCDRSFFYTEDAPSTDITEKIDAVFQERLRQSRLLELGLTASEFEKVDTQFDIRTATFDGQTNVKGINEIKAFIGGGFGYLIMMFIIIYGGFVMRSVIEEKTSRIIEVIISSVKPFQLMLGKIIGTSLAGITQFGIWLVSASVLLLVAFAVFDIDPSALNTSAHLQTGMGANMAPTIPTADQTVQLYAQELFRIPWVMLIFFFLVYFLLGYLIYSSIYAAIGAAVDNETDTQQFIFPIILPLMLAIYVGFFSVFSNPHGPIAVGFSLFPLTSPIVMLMRLPGGIGEGGVPVWELVTSILLLFGTFIGIVWLAAKIYRVGILMYGKKPTYKELFKWLKYD